MGAGLVLDPAPATLMAATTKPTNANGATVYENKRGEACVARRWPARGGRAARRFEMCRFGHADSTRICAHISMRPVRTEKRSYMPYRDSGVSESETGVNQFFT